MEARHIYRYHNAARPMMTVIFITYVKNIDVDIANILVA